jgi:hypothetical protein
MLNNKRTKVLAVILAVVIALYFILQYSGNTESNFRTTVMEIDTADLNTIVISPAKSLEKITLKKENGKWLVLNNTNNFEADPAKVNQLISSINNLAIQQVSAMSKEQWKKYAVTDSLANRIQFRQNEKVLADIMIGTFNYIQADPKVSAYGGPKGEIVTFIRVDNETPVYSISSQIGMMLGKTPNDYRDKSLTNLKEDQVNKIQFNYFDKGIFSLKKISNKWEADFDNAESATISKFVKMILRLNGSQFADNFNPESAAKSCVITIEGENMNPVVITEYQKDSTTVIHSSINPQSYFSGEAGKLTDRVFVNVDHFFEKK